MSINFFEKPVPIIFFEKTVTTIFFENPVTTMFFEKSVTTIFFENPVTTIFFEDPVTNIFFEKSFSACMFLAHISTFRQPTSPFSGPELVPGRPRPELRNVYFPRGCARPRPRAPARAGMFALKGGGAGGS